MAFHQCVSRSVVLVTKGRNPTEILAQSPHHLVLTDSVGQESVRQRWLVLALSSAVSGASAGKTGTSGGRYHWEAASLTHRLGWISGWPQPGLYASCLHVASAALGFSQGVGWVLENEPSKGINTSVITLLVGVVMGLARFKGKGQRLLLSKGGVSENLEPWFYTHNKYPFGFEVLNPNHRHLEGGGSKTESTDKDSQPQLSAARGCVQDQLSISFRQSNLNKLKKNFLFFSKCWTILWVCDIEIQKFRYSFSVLFYFSCLS